MRTTAPAPPPIELRIKEIGQLFHTLDPLPYRERDLELEQADDTHRDAMIRRLQAALQEPRLASATAAT